jgi:hypothetical protein
MASFQNRQMANLESLDAAEKGDIITLENMKNNGTSWDPMTLVRAVQGGVPQRAYGGRAVPDSNMATINYLLENGVVKNPAACAFAANLEVLKRLHECNVPWDEFVCINHIRAGRLDCLKYSIENGCPFILKDITEAAQFGQPAIAAWIVANKRMLAQLGSRVRVRFE